MDASSRARFCRPAAGAAAHSWKCMPWESSVQMIGFIGFRHCRHPGPPPLYLLVRPGGVQICSGGGGAMEK